MTTSVEGRGDRKHPGPAQTAGPGPTPSPAFSRPVARICTGAALVLWAWGAARVEPSEMSDAGLISVLGWQAPAAFLALSVAFALSVRDARSRHLLAAQTIALVVMVHGLPALVDPHPSYFTAYLHVGFVDEIIRNGHTVPELDARFNWPGSFGLAALIAAAGGSDSARWLMRWAPVVFNLAYLAPLWMLGRSLLADERARWVALWIFVAANWVHQDYLAPQAEAYFLYLVILAVAIRYFGGADPAGEGSRPVAGPAFLGRVRRRVQALAASADVPATHHTDDATSRFLLGSLVLMAATVVVSHQLTPFAIIVVTGALVLARSTRVTHLPVIVAVLAVGWFSVGATTWWSSHLGDLLGDVGRFGGNASAGLSARLGGSDLRAAVLWLRVAFSAALLGGAVLVALLRWRRGAPPLTALALLLPPFALIGGQSYGGEVLLRAYLFALPAAALLVGQGLSRVSRSTTPRIGTVVLAASLTVLAVTGITVRFGNEHFERVTSSDLAAVDWAYRNVPPGTVLIAPTRNLPWRYRDLTTYRYEPLDEQPLESAQAVLALVPDDEPAYLIATAAQQRFGEQLAFLPAGWLDSVTDELEASGRATVVFRQGDAVVYRLAPGGAR
jgi:hypothetical protein